MKIQGSVAFVTGANRGLGLAFARELLGRGAKTVYAGARNPDGIDLPGVVPVRLDVTDPALRARSRHLAWRHSVFLWGYQSCHFGNGVRSITVGKDE